MMLMTMRTAIISGRREKTIFLGPRLEREREEIMLIHGADNPLFFSDSRAQSCIPDTLGALF